MTRITSLQRTEQQVAALEQRVSHLSQQLGTIVATCRELCDAMETVAELAKHLPTVESLQERASAALETAYSLEGVR